MARHYTTSITGNGTTTQNTDPYLVNYHLSNTSVSVYMDTDGSTTTAQLQVTYDPLSTAAEVSAATWVNVDSTTTTDATKTITAPCTALRFQIGATGTDTWTFKVIQAGISD